MNARVVSSGFLAVSACLCLWVAMSHAVADPLARPSNPEAVSHLLKGNRLYIVREFREAIEQYKAGALIEDAPVFQYNLAQSYRSLGQHRDALWHYERFVNQSRPSGELRRIVDEFIAQMREEDHAGRDTDTASPNGNDLILPKRGVSDRRMRWYHDRLGWGVLATGTLLVAVSGYLFVDAREIDRLAIEEDRDVERDKLRKNASSRRLIGYIFAGVGLGTASVGVVRLVIHSGPSSSSLALSGSF